MEWIAQNRELITALTGVGTLLVWVVYLQVFVSSYRRQQRATLLITRGAGKGMEARCFLSNMSSGPVYVQSIIVTVEMDEDTLICPVTDMLDLEDEEAPADPRLRTRQGPLGSGQIRDIGSFGTLTRHVLRSHAIDPDVTTAGIQAISMEVVGIYGSEDLPVGARRRFVVTENGGKILVQGEGLGTRQIRSRWSRRRLAGDLERDP